MIRDEFKDKKISTNKEDAKIRKLGARQFYATSITKLKDGVKAINFSVKFSMILLTIAYALMLTVFCLQTGEEFLSLTWFVIWSSLYGVLVVLTVLWFTVFKKNMIKKSERYKKELDKLQKEQIQRALKTKSFYDGKE